MDSLCRREFMAGALAGLVNFASGKPAHAQEGTFKFGLTPVFLSNDLELLGHLKGCLSSKLGGAVELVSRRTYQEITALLVSGQINNLSC